MSLGLRLSEEDFGPRGVVFWGQLIRRYACRRQQMGLGLRVCFVGIRRKFRRGKSSGCNSDEDGRAGRRFSMTSCQTEPYRLQAA